MLRIRLERYVCLEGPAIYNLHDMRRPWRSQKLELCQSSGLVAQNCSKFSSQLFLTSLVQISYNYSIILLKVLYVFAFCVLGYNKKATATGLKIDPSHLNEKIHNTHLGKPQKSYFLNG